MAAVAGLNIGWHRRMEFRIHRLRVGRNLESELTDPVAKRQGCVRDLGSAPGCDRDTTEAESLFASRPSSIEFNLPQ